MEKGKKENVYKYLLGLWCKVSRLVLDGLCDPYKVARVLEKVILKVRLRRVYEDKVFRVGSRKFFVYEAAQEGTYLKLFRGIGELEDSRLTREEIKSFRDMYFDQIQFSREGVIFLLKEGGRNVVVHVRYQKDSKEYSSSYESLYRNTIWFKIKIVVPQHPYV